jgi:pyruvate ferredoxin oxidoreductase alpha subunit
MVCMDGFVLTHAVERVDVPEQDVVDAFLPAFEPRQLLDPAQPVSIGAMVGPEAFTEVKYLMHARQMQALDEIPRIAAEFEASFGRPGGGLVRPYRTEGADTVVVALGSQVGTIEVVVDKLRDEGHAVGLLDVTCFRPWPREAVRQALAGASRVVVVEKAFAVGAGGIVGQNTRLALAGTPTVVYDVVAGLGGRPVTAAGIRGLLEDVLADRVDPHSLHFLGLRRELVEQQLRRDAASMPGPHAESMLRDVGVIGSGAH